MTSKASIFRRLAIAVMAFVVGIVGFWSLSIETSSRPQLPLVLYFLLLFAITVFDYLLSRINQMRLSWKELAVLIVFPLLLGNSLLTGNETGMVTFAILGSWLALGWWFRNISRPKLPYFDYKPK